MEPLSSEERLKKAQHTSMLATFSVLLCVMGSCGGGLTLLIALPISLWGLKLARESLSGDDITDLVRAYALPARNIHGIAAIYTGLLLMLILILILFYALIFVAVIVTGI